MIHELENWITLIKPNDNQCLYKAQVKEVDTAMGLLGDQVLSLADQVLSLAELVGDNKAQLLDIDTEINSLYKNDAGSSAFIQKLQASPVTGMATLLYACQGRAGFLPYKGEYSLATLNQFITNLTRCPLINISDNKSFTSSGTFTSSDRVMPDSIVQNFLFGNGAENDSILKEQIQESLNHSGNNSFRLDIYNIELSGGTDTLVNIKAGTIDVKCTTELLKHNFSVLAKGFNVKLVMTGTNWNNSAPQIIKAIPFAPISQWIQVNDLTEL